MSTGPHCPFEQELLIANSLVTREVTRSAILYCYISTNKLSASLSVGDLLSAGDGKEYVKKEIHAEAWPDVSIKRVA